MKFIPTYAALGLKSEHDVFEYLSSTFSEVVRDWDYFVNWEKVFKNTIQFSSQLDLLNELVGTEDFEGKFRDLVRKNPSVLSVIPSLIVRDGAGSTKYEILSRTGDGSTVELFDFDIANPTDQQIDKTLKFIKESGLIRVFKLGGVKRLHDYLLGVEAGVDSNARKNRSGTAMESLIEAQIRLLVSENAGWSYITQATETQIRNTWDIEISGKKSARRFDFAILAGGQVVLVEVNIYGGGGSKLKSVAGEFVTLAEQLRAKNTKLVWITDGIGWKTALRPLQEAFLELDYVFNLDLLRHGALEEAIAQSNK
jgi:type II restriction enzyme